MELDLIGIRNLIMIKRIQIKRNINIDKLSKEELQSLLEQIKIKLNDLEENSNG